MIKRLNKIRVAKYKRVSTDEQKLKKNSIIAQDELLDQYIENHPEMVLVGDFSDEGVSGTKIKRTELDELLKMVEAKEVDLILVTKLDRWFRNIAFYYRVQEILERNSVAWKTILEDYDTLTADGRLKVNIMLSVAQNEAERTSERIKVVFDSKIKHKQAITGEQGLGWTTANGNGAKKVIINPETKAYCEAVLERVTLTQSIREAMLYCNEKFGVSVAYNSVNKFLKDTKLYGHYKGIDDYCEAYMKKEEFDDLQRIIKSNIKKRESNRVYIFSGLLICPECGHKLAGTSRTYKRPSGRQYTYNHYRCGRHRINKTCGFAKSVSQNVIERKVLAQVMPQLEKLELEANIQEKQIKAPRVNKTAIKDEMDRLNKMFQKGRIKEDEYDRQYEELEKKLQVKKAVPKKDYTELKKLLSGTLGDLYKTFTDKEKQMFWRSIIESIELDGDDVVINFL